MSCSTPQDRPTSPAEAPGGRPAGLGELFWSFFRVGLMTFGGGYAMLPPLEYEVCERRRWISRDELLDWYGLAQVVPGVIALNTATFIGRSKAGYPGAVTAVAGVIAPSVLVIVTLAAAIGQVEQHPVVVAAFIGLRAGVGGLLAATAVRIARTSCSTSAAWALMAASTAVALAIRGGAFWVIVGALLCGSMRAWLRVRQEPSQAPAESHGPEER